MAEAKVETVALSKLAGDLAEKHEISKKAAVAIAADVIGLIGEQLKLGHKVRVAGLGIFQVRKREARMVRNPLTKEMKMSGPSKKVAFRPAKDLKDSI